MVSSHSRGQDVCSDLEPDCFELLFCEASRCAVDLRRGLIGQVSYCPICASSWVLNYPSRPQSTGTA
jgi:hypothetical protein